MLRYWTIFLGYIYLFVQAFKRQFGKPPEIAVDPYIDTDVPKNDSHTPISWPD